MTPLPDLPPDFPDELRQPAAEANVQRLIRLLRDANQRNHELMNENARLRGMLARKGHIG